MICPLINLPCVAAARAPQSEAELLKRAHAIAGKTLQELAEQMGSKVPKALLHAKGWTGQLLESYLVTTAGTKSAPDFEHLQIELKTIPIDAQQRPKETTYVCVAPLIHQGHIAWRDSIVYQKLKRVLWVPIEADPALPIHKRRIGVSVLWSPSQKQEEILKHDFEEHMEKICLGQVESISAYQGVYLQIRPKAANSKALTAAIGLNGTVIQTLPRGFYLRTQFTEEILRQSYHA